MASLDFSGILSGDAIRPGATGAGMARRVWNLPEKMVPPAMGRSQWLLARLHLSSNGLHITPSTDVSRVKNTVQQETIPTSNHAIVG
ncbi:hypothetical protein [Sinimarinibacterium sp. NLF-5-8]|uniref:hypothetical protein n=1 Tax=Sinimarinibacterium sp. NLF-5-8 TaxID=2698684 RepID=UPI00137BD6D0|nr:hypothetical protein [Sinimarinibacterium sp. NLF-5-8]QHS11111.1 hypothetical protein GT972_13830 [Sinimarinibacterium sp. NLF-5-8]